MATRERQEFKINSSFPAVVTKVKDDRVFFDINRNVRSQSGFQSTTEKAAFFVKGHLFNPHLFFKKGDLVSVRVCKVCKPPQNYYGLNYVVIPEILPADIYIATHPVGSMVSGIISRITGATMIVSLADNVSVITKRSRRARTGTTVECKIDKYHAKKISVRVF